MPRIIQPDMISTIKKTGLKSKKMPGPAETETMLNSAEIDLEENEVNQSPYSRDHFSFKGNKGEGSLTVFVQRHRASSLLNLS